MLRYLIAALALVSAPASFAQQAQDLKSSSSSNEPDDAPLLYLSGGLAWSGELGIELEAGVQLDLGNVRLRASPLNLSLFDGDLPPGFFWDGVGINRNCRYSDTGALAIEDECRPEVDAEWRSVVEGQIKLSSSFYLGAGATYLLQGDFKPQDGRFAGFASFAWEAEDGTSLELRAGSEYLALQMRSRW